MELVNLSFGWYALTIDSNRNMYATNVITAG
jgi:hypothetical protein